MSLPHINTIAPIAYSVPKTPYTSAELQKVYDTWLTSCKFCDVFISTYKDDNGFDKEFNQWRPLTNALIFRVRRNFCKVTEFRASDDSHIYIQRLRDLYSHCMNDVYEVYCVYDAHNDKIWQPLDADMLKSYETEKFNVAKIRRASPTKQNVIIRGAVKTHKRYRHVGTIELFKIKKS